MARNYPKKPRRGDGCIGKRELDIRLASNIGMGWKQVATITDAFIDELLIAITHHGGFVLPRLGRLHVNVETNNSNLKHVKKIAEPHRIRLYFRKSDGLKEMLERRLGIYTKKGETPWTSNLKKA